MVYFCKKAKRMKKKKKEFIAVASENQWGIHSYKPQCTKTF
jgi:hypothetical protein